MMQGTTLKVPIVDKQNLDLHKLHKVVVVGDLVGGVCC